MATCDARRMTARSKRRASSRAIPASSWSVREREPASLSPSGADCRPSAEVSGDAIVLMLVTTGYTAFTACRYCSFVVHFWRKDQFFQFIEQCMHLLRSICKPLFDLKQEH